MIKKTLPVSIGIFWDGSEWDVISLWMQRRDDEEEGHFNGLWEFPGGKIEEGESPLEAVVREVEEEVGIDISCEILIKFFGYYKVEYKDKNILLHVFLIDGNRDLLPSDGYWVQFSEEECAQKIKKQTLPINENIINDILYFIRSRKMVGREESIVWN